MLFLPFALFAGSWQGHYGGQFGCVGVVDFHDRYNYECARGRELPLQQYFGRAARLRCDCSGGLAGRSART